MGKIEDLQKIKKLLDEGLVTQKEFDNLKIDIIGKPDSNDSNNNIESINNNIDNVKEKFNTDKKECPNCKSIVLIKSIKCSYCNYDFILKRNPVVNNFKDGSPESNFEIKPKEEEQHQINQDDGNSNKKL